MFVTVRYGEDQSRLFNINCRNEVLLHQIKKRCKMDRDEVIELSDEQGVVKNLRQNLDQYGYDYLKERESVILLRVDSCVPDNIDILEDNDSLSDKAIFIPMLTAMTENQEFIEALNPKDHLSNKNDVDDVDGKGKKKNSKDKKKGDKTKANNKPLPPKK